jgi:hypothetical protein
MPATTHVSILSDAMLKRFAERAPGYDRDNRFFTEDFAEMKQAGYLTCAVPPGSGAVHLRRVQEQQRLAYRPPAASRTSTGRWPPTSGGRATSRASGCHRRGQWRDLRGRPPGRRHIPKAMASKGRVVAAILPGPSSWRPHAHVDLPRFARPGLSGRPAHGLPLRAAGDRRLHHQGHLGRARQRAAGDDLLAA